MKNNLIKQLVIICLLLTQMIDASAQDYHGIFHIRKYDSKFD